MKDDVVARFPVERAEKGSHGGHKNGNKTVLDAISSLEASKFTTGQSYTVKIGGREEGKRDEGEACERKRLHGGYRHYSPFLSLFQPLPRIIYRPSAHCLVLCMRVGSTRASRCFRDRQRWFNRDNCPVSIGLEIVIGRKTSEIFVSLSRAPRCIYTPLFVSGLTQYLPQLGRKGYVGGSIAPSRIVEWCMHGSSISFARILWTSV